ncbi:MAG: hypothetical protein ABWX63_03150 [Paeniglutamicibacter terrestris]
MFLEALGQQTIDAGMRVSWLSVEDPGSLVRRHRIDDSVNKASPDLICIDNIAPLPVSDDATKGVPRIVDTAYEK